MNVKIRSASFSITDTCQRTSSCLSAIAGLSMNRISSLLHFNILPPPTNPASFIPPEPIGISFDGTMMWVVCVCLESVWPRQRCAEQSRPTTGAESPAGPKSVSGSRTVLHNIGVWAVTHPLSVVWDGVEVGVNCRSAMEKLTLLSVSENEG